MKQLQTLFLPLILLGLFSSFKPNQSCEYASSNVSYVKSEIEKAVAMTDLQLTRFHTYKAINAIEKSKDELDNCGCEYAIDNITLSSEHLKMATKTSTLASTAIFLNKALKETSDTLTSLKEHNTHKSSYGNDVLALNTVNLTNENEHGSYTPPTEELLKQKVDSSLISYRASLDKMISTVNCREARAYADRIFEHCEQQLLKSNLSEGKKYYNLKTKEITAEAIEKLGECGK